MLGRVMNAESVPNLRAEQVRQRLEAMDIQVVSS